MLNKIADSMRKVVVNFTPFPGVGALHLVRATASTNVARTSVSDAGKALKFKLRQVSNRR